MSAFFTRTVKLKLALIVIPAAAAALIHRFPSSKSNGKKS